MKKTAEELLQRPYWIIDIMPSQVPEGSPVKYGKQKSRCRRLLKWIGSEHYLQKFYEVHTRMEEMDWTQLMRYVDSQMDNLCLRLFSEKGMKQDDVNFCILLLLNFSHINMANIMNCTRSAIYKRERYILQHRFGITDKDKRLKDVLMEMAQENK